MTAGKSQHEEFQRRLLGQGYKRGYACPSGALYFEHPTKWSVCLDVAETDTYYEGYDSHDTSQGFVILEAHKVSETLKVMK